MKKIDLIASILVLLGALNWGLAGAFDMDFMAKVLGESATLSRIAYVLVGASAVYLGVTFKTTKNRMCASA